jgi:predicted nucleotidyltransferase
MNDEIIEKFLDIISPLMEQIKGMYLFGSRCRDDWRPDSDYDILVVLEKKERVIIDRLYDAVMDVLLSTGRLISLKIFTASEFNRLKSIPTPFVSNVLKEGKKIGSHD